MNFVSGYNATPNGGTVNTIGMATQMVYGAALTTSTTAAAPGTLSLTQAATLTFAQVAGSVTGVIAAFAAAPLRQLPRRRWLSRAHSLRALLRSQTTRNSTHYIYDNPAAKHQWHGHGNDLRRVRSTGKTQGRAATITGFTTALGVACFNVSSQTYTPVGAWRRVS